MKVCVLILARRLNQRTAVFSFQNAGTNTYHSSPRLFPWTEFGHEILARGFAADNQRLPVDGGGDGWIVLTGPVSDERTNTNNPSLTYVLLKMDMLSSPLSGKSALL